MVESIHILETAGLNASIRNIRERIGKGSLTTIAQHKREYELTTAATPREALPDPIAKALLSGAEAYWQELVDAAEAEIAKIQASADASVAELISRASKLETELVDAQEALNGESLSRKAVEDTLAVAESTKSGLESELQSKSTELAAISARLDEARLVAEKSTVEREDLANQLKEAQSDVAKLIERCDNVASKHASELARLNTELAEAVASKESLGKQLDSATRATVKAAQEARENAARVNAAETECKAAQEAVARLSDELEQQRSAADDRRSELEARLASQTTLVNEKESRIADLKQAHCALEQALKSRKKPKKKKQGT